MAYAYFAFFFMYGNFNAQEEQKKHTTKHKTYNKAGTGVTNLYNKEYSEQISKQDGTDLHKDLYKKNDKMIRNTKAAANR